MKLHASNAGKNLWLEVLNMISEAAFGFLKISQYSQENMCVKVSFHKFEGLQAYNFIKKRHQSRYFPVNVAKF